jgi:hypothetical protein
MSEEDGEISRRLLLLDLLSLLSISHGYHSLCFFVVGLLYSVTCSATGPPYCSRVVIVKGTKAK